MEFYKVLIEEIYKNLNTKNTTKKKNKVERPKKKENANINQIKINTLIKSI